MAKTRKKVTFQDVDAAKERETAAELKKGEAKFTLKYTGKDINLHTPAKANSKVATTMDSIVNDKSTPGTEKTQLTSSAMQMKTGLLKCWADLEKEIKLIDEEIKTIKKPENRIAKPDISDTNSDEIKAFKEQEDYLEFLVKEKNDRNYYISGSEDNPSIKDSVDKVISKFCSDINTHPISKKMFYISKLIKESADDSPIREIVNITKMRQDIFDFIFSADNEVVDLTNSARVRQAQKADRDVYDASHIHGGLNLHRMQKSEKKLKAQEVQINEWKLLSLKEGLSHFLKNKDRIKTILDENYSLLEKTTKKDKSTHKKMATVDDLRQKLLVIEGFYSRFADCTEVKLLEKERQAIVEHAYAAIGEEPKLEKTLTDSITASVHKSSKPSRAKNR